ncbi:hypothetical protein M758_4G018800 [Ceratodon purpureus]|uniref:Uncharacterized protein n=1 Tax=Ceratodon purpureus TaxID=3225 RepID=A0A8T0I4J3_CERPU|nr:hypothetical protein KC19_4G020900 [Ceratodon purpureus]KAG0578415.1 hypothetical protein KC19_4G020900 [Ceratodon purpureus]KAG0617836.1 hypothetical protein M758_4G018800 [Ceratodon purpureus]
MAMSMAISRALCVLLLLGVAAVMSAEAVKIETFNERGCTGGATNTFYVGRNQCQDFIDQGSVRVTEIDPDVRVSFHNQQGCEGASSVGQGHGSLCMNQGATKLRSVYVA